MLAAAQWLDATLRPARTVCMIHPDNAASLKVAARVGFREFTRADYRDHPAILMQR